MALPPNLSFILGIHKKTSLYSKKGSKFVLVFKNQSFSSFSYVVTPEKEKELCLSCDIKSRLAQHCPEELSPGAPLALEVNHPSIHHLPRSFIQRVLPELLFNAQDLG